MTVGKNGKLKIGVRGILSKGKKKLQERGSRGLGRGSLIFLWEEGKCRFDSLFSIQEDVAQTKGRTIGLGEKKPIEKRKKGVRAGRSQRLNQEKGRFRGRGLLDGGLWTAATITAKGISRITGGKATLLH